jgi:KinB signaling pathway activation protein
MGVKRSYPVTFVSRSYYVHCSPDYHGQPLAFFCERGKIKDVKEAKIKWHFKDRCAEIREDRKVNLKKWFFLFWSSMAVGAVVCVLTGAVMQWIDPEFGFLGFKAVGFNAMMMAMVGLMIGAFSQMGFFSYLTLNYIALSVFGKKYLWNALQGYTTVFAAAGLGYVLYEKKLNGWFFWVLPVALLLVSALVTRMKVAQTNKSALVPTMFLILA